MKKKDVFTLTVLSDKGPAAVYTCLKTLVEDVEQMEHYSTIYRSLRSGVPYEDGQILIKKHDLRKSKYNKKRAA